MPHLLHSCSAKHFRVGHNMKYGLLALPIALAACAAPSNSPQGIGSSNPTPSGQSTQASPPTTQTSISSTSLRRAAESAFGYGRPRDDVPVSVAGRSMAMRIVNVKGQNFAILQEKGVPFSLSAPPDLSGEAQMVAQRSSGCLTTGNTWTKRYSNGAHPKYAVHVICS